MGDPRWALVLAAMLAALMATGGNEEARITAHRLGQAPPVALPNLYAMLATLVPGLESVRAAEAIGTGVHLTLSILSGLGAAALARLAPHRRTSSCLNSFLPPFMFKLQALAKRLPSRKAIRRFRRMGFTTIAIHHPLEGGQGRVLLRKFERAAAMPASLLERIYGNDSMTAFAFVG